MNTNIHKDIRPQPSSIPTASSRDAVLLVYSFRLNKCPSFCLKFRSIVYQLWCKCELRNPAEVHCGMVSNPDSLVWIMMLRNARAPLSGFANLSNEIQPVLRNARAFEICPAVGPGHWTFKLSCGRSPLRWDRGLGFAAPVLGFEVRWLGFTPVLGLAVSG